MAPQTTTQLNGKELEVPETEVKIGGDIPKDVQKEAPEFMVYKRRWFMLVLFSACSMCNAFQWIQYSIITNIITRYYDVEPVDVDWLSMIYMIAYVPLIFPATFVLDKKGLRWSVLLGVLGTALGGWIKVFAVSPDRFYVTFIGQTVAAVAQIFTFGIPPRLAAVWFGPGQVSTACSIGVFGNQLGLALGFLLPPLLVTNHKDLADIGYDLKIMFYGSSVVPTVLFVLVIFFFQEAPPLPPSPSRAVAIEAAASSSYKKSLKNVLTNPNFILLLFSYAFSLGVMNTIVTLLNQLILSEFPGHEDDAGMAGVANVLCGLVGASVLGVWLDKSHKFKETSIVVYILNIAGMLSFTLTLYYQSLPLVYVGLILLGLFMSAYLTLGFEYAAELTYPESEGTTGGLLNAVLYLFSVAFTSLSGWILRNKGNIFANLFCCGILLLGLFLTLLIKPDLRRQAEMNKNGAGGAASSTSANPDVEKAVKDGAESCKG